MGIAVLLVTLLAILCGGCGVYSFTGASIDPALRTFRVVQFQNQAANVVPTLSQALSERLRDKILNQTSLKSVDRDGDATFAGTITDYSIAPAAVQAGSTTALNRLSISVQIKYENKADPKSNFDQGFRQYQDFDNRQPVTAVQDELIRQISLRLSDDIFNRAFVNW